MSNIRFLNGKQVHLVKEIPTAGDQAPNINIVNIDQQIITLEDFKSEAVVLYSVPGIDSEKCFKCHCQINAIAKQAPHVSFIGISMDLPMTLSRVARTEDLDNIYLMSDYLGHEFGTNYGLLMQDGILAGLLARSIFVLNNEHQIIFSVVSKHVCHGFDEDGEELAGLKEAITYLKAE